MYASLRELTRLGDGMSCLYAEHAVVERQDTSIAFYRKEGAMAVPAASLGVLVLGPGTRITHAAMVCLAECGVTTVWAGEDYTRCYAWGTGKTRSSLNLLRQAAAWAAPDSRMSVIRRMYVARFPDPLPEGLSLAQIRGREGVRVRQAYAAASREYGVTWHGRSYDRNDWKSADPVNRALSSGAASLYGVCHAGIVAAGYSPGIGFIHTGKQLSFVYDIADLYKADILVPAAFTAAAEHPESPEAAVRKIIREHMWQARLLDRVVKDLDMLFAGLASGQGAGDYDDADAPGALWDPDGVLPGGMNHGGDDS